MEKVNASFRDPSGYVVRRHGVFLRVVQPVYREHYDLLMGSGLYASLAQRPLMLPHEETGLQSEFSGAYKVLQPRQLDFVSYPYEWCFSQLKDAALATLQIQKAAIDHGMSLKDATAYNIQFVDGRALLMDTLSFEKLPEGKPWVAYQQFCRHFLAPLALMSRRDVRLGQLSRIYLDGVPLELASSLLPWRTRLTPWLLVHLHLHASSQRRLGHRPVEAKTLAKQYSIRSLRGLLDSLESAVQGLTWKPAKQVWANYYEETVTGGNYVAHKQKLVGEYLDTAAPKTVWDLGSNTGLFSRLAASGGRFTLSFDSDPDCVEVNYLEGRKKKEPNLLPLLMDLTNPSPSMGWAHGERMSWLERSGPDLAMALALVHHLAIGNNLPLDRIAEFFARLGPWLIIEFVPKDDPNAQKLLNVREDIFHSYTREGFETAFRTCFSIEKSSVVENSERRLYLMRRLR